MKTRNDVNVNSKKKYLEVLLTFCTTASWVEVTYGGCLSQPPLQAGTAEGPSSGEAGALLRAISCRRGQAPNRRLEVGPWRNSVRHHW
jgi:hypothetical protein